jgi:hypothetical protein
MSGDRSEYVAPMQTGRICVVAASELQGLPLSITIDNDPEFTGKMLDAWAYPDRATATSDVFDYIEMIYKPIRRHGSVADLSPVEF